MDVSVKCLANSVTLQVRLVGARQWSIRLRVAAALIRLAAWVAWMNVEIAELEDT